MRQRRSSWSLTKWIGNRGSILSPAPCCHSAQCGGVCLDMGLELNPLLPWLGSLQRQLFIPYGWDSAPPPLLSNDAFLTDIQREPLFQEGRSTQYFLGYREEKQGTPPSLNLPVPPCIYMHSLWHHTKDVHTPSIFCQPRGHSSSSQNCASVLVDALVSSCGRYECSQGTTPMVAVLHPRFSYHSELRGGH